MVTLQVADGTLEVEVQGWHKLWAFKRRIRVSLAAIGEVQREHEATSGLWKGLRAPGTHLPGVVVAGPYYRAGERHFWDVRHGDRAIAIELEGQRYDRLVVEVEDPDAAIELLDRARLE